MAGLGAQEVQMFLIIGEKKLRLKSDWVCETRGLICHVKMLKVGLSFLG